MTDSTAPIGTVDLYWIPLGAGAHVVRMSGRIFEALDARWHHRLRRDLYHTALEVSAPDGRYVIEQTPVVDRNGAARGVVGEGPVGTRWAGHVRVFRYEVRCWRDGLIPDVDHAVSAVRVSNDPDCARRLLDALPAVPTPVWGRDELRAGEMWNSNSVVSWALVRSGVDVTVLRPPFGGRAPGWDAGIAVAAREPSAATWR